MSLATLKRKTEAKYNNMSVNTGEGFSLNGTRRNQGYVGQTSSSRSLIRGLRNGQYLRGHGSCCSTGTETPITQNEYTCLEDNTVIKRSSLSMMGMLKTRYCNNTCNIVKPDNNNNANTQADFIYRKKKECLNCTVSTVDTSTPSINCDVKCKTDQNIHTKPDEAYLIQPSSQYIEQLNKGCTNLDKVIIEYSVQRTPFAGFN